MNKKECEQWFDDWVMWRSGKLESLPQKPKGFDLWLLGDNPLNLEIGEAKSKPLVELTQPVTQRTLSRNFTIQLELKLGITPNDTPNV